MENIYFNGNHKRHESVNNIGALLCDAGIDVFVRKFNINADSESVFHHLFGQSKASFWLDSNNELTDNSRFSYMGDASGPLSSIIYYNLKEKQLTVRTDNLVSCRHGIFDFLELKLSQLTVNAENVPFDFIGGFVGYFGYEIKSETCSDGIHQATTPDAAFIFADRMIVFDRKEKEVYLVCLYSPPQKESAQRWIDETRNTLHNIPHAPRITTGRAEDRVVFTMRHSQQGYMERIKKCFSEINNGETYEVCLTNEIRTAARVDHLSLYRILRKMNPAPFSAYIKLENFSIICSSPERFLKIDRNRVAESKPIKGTVRRGNDENHDRNLCKKLQEDEKFRSENLMIVDLLRNDIGSVSEVGSVHVEKLMDVETYQTLHQLVSTIKGTLRKDVTNIDCLKAVFPGGSMTGAPKKRTLGIIDALEDGPRGVYSGSIGFLSLNNRADFNIVIRTIVATENELSIGVGGAIIALSDAKEEFDEMLLKAKAPMQAITYAICGRVNIDNYTIADRADYYSSRLVEGAGSLASVIRAARIEDIDSIIVMVEKLIGEVTGSGNIDLTNDPECTHVCKQVLQGDLDGAIFVSHQLGLPEKLTGLITIMTNTAIRAKGRYASIEELWVDPRCRSKGVGAMLINAAVEFCKKRNISRIEVGLPPFAFKDYQKTDEFYTENGFQVIGSRMKRMIGSETR